MYSVRVIAFGEEYKQENTPEGGVAHLPGSGISERINTDTESLRNTLEIEAVFILT